MHENDEVIDETMSRIGNFLIWLHSSIQGALSQVQMDHQPHLRKRLEKVLYAFVLKFQRVRPVELTLKFQEYGGCSLQSGRNHNGGAQHRSYSPQLDQK
jgi:hypothetical protein